MIYWKQKRNQEAKAMINFASLFGTFNRGGSSAINDLLEKKTTTLDQLLDIETFPNEYKSGNAKIVEL